MNLSCRKQLIACAYSPHRTSQHSGTDGRMPEERSEKSNYNNAKDKAPRVETQGLVVVGGQPVGIAHAKLLGRPPQAHLIRH